MTYTKTTSWYKKNNGRWEYNHSSEPGWLFNQDYPTDLDSKHDEMVKSSEWKKQYNFTIREEGQMPKVEGLFKTGLIYIKNLW